MLTILIPCAGAGSRFAAAGYTMPKPLIDVEGRPMLERVIDNIRPTPDTKWVFVTRKGMISERQIKPWLKGSDFMIIELSNDTDGAARTCLMADMYIDNSVPLLIANCDQLVIGHNQDYGLADLMTRVQFSGSVMTFPGDGSTRWSYAQIDGRKVVRIVEKQPISDRATCGLYWFARGKDFVKAAHQMIDANDRVNGEFYVAPTINYMIRDGFKVREIRVEDFKGKFWGLGTPEDLKLYLERKK